jgi:hypothetical protein
MRTMFKAMLGVVFGLFLFTAISLMGGDHAKAQSTCCSPPARPCSSCTQPNPCNCTPPTPPVTQPCNCDNRHNVNVPNVNVWVNAAVIVNANVNANASAAATATASGSGTGTGNGSGNGFGTGVGTGFGAGNGFGAGFGGGGAGPGFTTGVVSALPDIVVQSAPARRRVAYEASRTKTVKIIIQAFCLDDRGEPHPASQVFPEKDVDNAYDGELYRCIAGTRMQYVMADFNEKISFDGGKSITCDKDQALYHTKDAKLECRKQAAARDCNERSLLRRFGAGIKILTIVTVETYTAYREEEIESSSVTTSSSSTSTGYAAGGVVTGAY